MGRERQNAEIKTQAAITEASSSFLKPHTHASLSSETSTTSHTRKESTDRKSRLRCSIFGRAVAAVSLINNMNIFSKKPTAKEVVRESKREMANATRGIEREINTLQLEEKKLVAEIKRTAKKGNDAATKILARQLIRLRQQIAKLQSSRAQMRGIATHTQAMSAQTSVAVGMKGASKAMAAMNKQMAPTKQAKVIQEFQRQSAQLDMTTELMSDTIDEALDDDEAEDETEELTNQVLDEIGVDIVSQLSSAPKGKIAGKNSEAAGSSNDDELEKRLAALRNP